MYPDTKIVSGEFTRKNYVPWKMSPETTADISGDKNNLVSGYTRNLSPDTTILSDSDSGDKLYGTRTRSWTRVRRNLNH